MTEEKVIETEDLHEIDRRVNEILDTVNGIPELEEVVLKMLEIGMTRPRYLAEAIGIPVQEINNRLKRIRRKLLNPRKP